MVVASIANRKSQILIALAAASLGWAPAWGDVVTTARGDRITGTVVAIDAGGKLHLAGPDFAGEVVVLASALKRIDFDPAGRKITPPTRAPGPVAPSPRRRVILPTAGGDEVLLTSGDRVIGEVSAITADAVIVESSAAGALKIARKVVKSVAFAGRSSGLVESAFRRGILAPWAAQGGSWKVADGALQCVSSGSTQTIFASLDQTEAVTIVARVEATGGPYLQVCLVLFADAMSGECGRNSVFARFYRNRCYLMYARNGSYRNVTTASAGRTLKGGTLRLAYDPATGQAKAWLDAKLLCQRAIPNRPKTGRLVMFSSRYPCRVSYIRVLRGVVAPCGQQVTGHSTGHIVHLGNRDRIAAESVTVADGKLLLKTSFGELSSPLDKVRAIAFRTEGLETPRRNKGDVWVDTPDGRLTLQFGELTPEHLVGESACLGQVRIRRKSIKTIRFNIYK